MTSTDFLDRKPGQLSGGQRQRVAMGRAIVRDPKAFLMDEPLSNLDAKLRVQMRSEIARLQNRLGTTTVYVTHDQTEAMTLGDRVVVLLGGMAQQIGTPEELYNSPANLFVAGFIGSPSMNFFPATHDRCRGAAAVRRGHAHPGSSRPAGAAPEAQQLIVGIRPEHLEDAALLDGYARIRALTFEVKVDFVESLGADKYVHFKTEGAGAQAAQLAELAAESGVGENEFVARVSTESKVTQGQTMQLAFDTSKIAIFDADTGENLTLPASGSNGQPAPTSAAPEQPPRRRASPQRRSHRPSDRRPGGGPCTSARALRPGGYHRGTRCGERDVPRHRTHRCAAIRPRWRRRLHYVSLGCSRHPMFDPTEMVTDALRGPRAEVVVALRGASRPRACPARGDPGRSARGGRFDTGTRRAGGSAVTAVGFRAVHRVSVGPQRH